jgi:glycosyltransferase involved in cell wall biosynthesis
MTSLLVVTSLFPTSDRPEAGVFVARRVQALRDRGVSVEVIAAHAYDKGPIRRHLEMGLAAARPRRIHGVEAHVLLPAGLIGLVAAQIDRAPLLVYAHGADVRETARRTRLHAILARTVARGAGIVVANSRATSVQVGQLGVEAHVVPPGVDFGVFAPAHRGAARKHLALPDSAKIVVYVGALSQRKGADVFAEAISGIPEVLGVAVGRGELDEVIARRWPSVRLNGPATPDEVPRWMQAADLVVVPSREEPLGLAAVEALACGVPVVAAAVGGLIDVVTDGVNGRLVPPDDPEALRQAVNELVQSDVVRMRLAAAARASVARHDRQVVDAQMAELWAMLHVAV